MRHLTWVLVPVAAVLSMAVSAWGAEVYKIKFTRPCTVGETFRVQVQCSVKQTSVANAGPGEKQEKTESYDAKIEGVTTVEAVTEKEGQPTKVSVKVTTCTNEGAELVPAGSVIEADATNGDPKFTIDGKEVTDAKMVSILQQIVPVHRANQGSDDQLMGTDVPRKVGDSWPVNREELAKSFSKGAFRLEAGDLKGTVTLTDVSTHDNVAVENFKVALTGAVDKRAMDGGTDLQNLKLEITGGQTLPVDEKNQATSEQADTKMTFTVVTGSVTVDATMEQHQKGTIEPITK